MGKTTPRGSASSSAATSCSRVQLYPSGSFWPMCVCTSNGARPGSSATSLSSQGRMRSSENTSAAYPGDGAAAAPTPQFGVADLHDHKCLIHGLLPQPQG